MCDHPEATMYGWKDAKILELTSSDYSLKFD